MSLRFFYPYKNVHDECHCDWWVIAQKQHVLKICIPGLVVVAAIFLFKKTSNCKQDPHHIPHHSPFVNLSMILYNLYVSMLQ